MNTRQMRTAMTPNMIVFSTNFSSNVCGDTLAILAAATVGVYAIQVRLWCPLDKELVRLHRRTAKDPFVPCSWLFSLWKWRWQRKYFFGISTGIIRLCFFSEYLHFRAVQCYHRYSRSRSRIDDTHGFCRGYRYVNKSKYSLYPIADGHIQLVSY